MNAMDNLASSHSDGSAIGWGVTQTTLCDARKAHTNVMRLRIGYASKHGSVTALDIRRRV